MPSLVKMVGRGTPMGRESAAGCLWSMSVVDVAIKEVATMQGAVVPQCELLSRGAATAKKEACGALWSLARPMVAMLVGGSSKGARAQAHLALKYLCSYRSAIPRAVERELTEVDYPVIRLLPTSGGKMVLLIDDGMGKAWCLVTAATRPRRTTRCRRCWSS